jgi:hypothetical protein
MKYAGLFDEQPIPLSFATLRLHPHLEHGFDDALGNCIVAAAGAQRGFAALVVDYAEADAVGLWF